MTGAAARFSCSCFCFSALAGETRFGAQFLAQIHLVNACNATGWSIACYKISLVSLFGVPRAGWVSAKDLVDFPWPTGLFLGRVLPPCRHQKRQLLVVTSHNTFVNHYYLVIIKQHIWHHQSSKYHYVWGYLDWAKIPSNFSRRAHFFDHFQASMRK